MNLTKTCTLISVIILLLVSPVVSFARCCGHGRGGGGGGRSSGVSRGGYSGGRHGIPESDIALFKFLIAIWFIPYWGQGILYDWIFGWRRWFFNFFKPINKRCTDPFGSHYKTYIQSIESYMAFLVIIYFSGLFSNFFIAIYSIVGACVTWHYLRETYIHKDEIETH